MLKRFQIATSERSDMIALTDDIRAFVESTGVQEGTVTVFIPHTTAALTITSFWDPAGFEDLKDEVNRLIPTRIDFQHQFDTPSDAAGHVKSSLMGISLPLIVTGGKLLLGGSQGIYFMEFDGPRKREYFVKVQADPS